MVKQARSRHGFLLRRCRTFAAAALCVAATMPALAQGIVTLTQQEIAGLMAAACGPEAVSSKGMHVHRNEAGNMLYIVGSGKAEALIYAQQQACNPLSPETLNLWRRSSDGAVTAQLAHRYEGERLLMENMTDGVSGKHFDLSAGGQYMLVSHGEASSVSPIDRPYMRTIELQMDARRIFMRSDGGLLVVGSNKATNQLEAVPVSLQGGTAVAGAPIPVPGVPAGVLVLDYNAKTNELLLGGEDGSGNKSFAIANLSTGQGRVVPNAKPGAVTALFISDPGLLAKLNGQPVPQSSAQQAPQAGGEQQGGGFSLNPRSWFGRR